MVTPHILLVDDDPDITEIICLYLSNANYTVTAAETCTEALRQLESHEFDLILLDIMLPDCDGVDFCYKIRGISPCPILFISCLDEEEKILKAFLSGGDDYIRKPFYPRELVARVDCHLRKTEAGTSSEDKREEIIYAGDLKINQNTCEIYKHEDIIPLSPIEYDILLFMTENRERVLSYSEIYSRVWKNESFGDTRTVMVHVSNLRKKLEEKNPEKYIKTVKKRGYVFNA